MVRWDRDIASRDQRVDVVQAKLNAPLGISPDDHEGRRLDELEFQLGAAGVGSAYTERGIQILEDNTLATVLAVGLECCPLVSWICNGGHRSQVRVPRFKDHQQPGTAMQVTLLAEVVAFEFQQVEGMESIADCLAVDQDIEG